MKLKTFFVLLPLLLFISADTSKNGISFYDGTFSEALKSAKDGNKIVFVDVYASWCGPCKQMEKKVFVNEDLGSFFNEHFISYKLDIDKPEGKKIKKEYKIYAVPTLLFLSSEGKLLKQVVGYQDKQQLLKIGKNLVKKS
jgi:thioredoxin-related protein